MQHRITLKNLEQIFVGDINIVKQMLEIYFTSFDKQYHLLKANYQSKNLIQLKANLHSLKGMLSIFGVIDLLDLIKRLEGYCLNSQQNEIDSLFATFCAEVEEFNTQLRQIQKELSDG